MYDEGRGDCDQYGGYLQQQRDDRRRKEPKAIKHGIP